MIFRDGIRAHEWWERNEEFMIFRDGIRAHERGKEMRNL
jgi:hypothetical protein